MIFPPMYVLRHGQTTWNAEKRIQGSLDSPLTALGEAQARQQNAILVDRDLAKFDALTSPQGRALATAKIALSGLCERIESNPSLAEIGVGVWEGMRRADLPLAESLNETEDGALELYGKAPGGEGFEALYQRCNSFLCQLERPSILVTHGITSRMLRVILMGRDVGDIDLVDGGQGVVFYLKDGAQTKLSLGA